MSDYKGWRMSMVWDGECPASPFEGEIELRKFYIYAKRLT